MEIFTKNLKEINESDLRELELSFLNFEDYQIEFKFKYDADPNEFRRDIIQFANGLQEGFIFFGVKDNPIKFVGLERKEIDELKLILNNILPRKIEPILSPFPDYHVIKLSNDNYIFIVKIYPKKHGIYAIRLNDNPSKLDFRRYEFYRRMDGSKHQMSIDEVIELIEIKSKGSKKLLEVTIHPTTLNSSNFDDVFISIQAVNKGIRPITVNSYGISIIKEEFNLWIPSHSVPNRFVCDRLPRKLLDGDACYAYLSRTYFEQEMEENGWKYPLEVKAFFSTTDGRFYSESIILEKFK